MSSGLWALIGVIIGGAITFAVQWWSRRQERVEKRGVAARTLYGDMAVVEAVCEIILKTKMWPDRLDFAPAISTWVEFRGAFAPGVTALEWTHLGAFYSNLERTSLMIRPSQECSDGDLKVIKNLHRLAGRAKTAAAKHTAKTLKEMQEVVAEYGQASHGGGSN
jgi:hypothetical protein